MDVYLVYDYYEYEGIGNIYGIFLRFNDAVDYVKEDAFKRHQIDFKKTDDNEWRSKDGLLEVVIEKWILA